MSDDHGLTPTKREDAIATLAAEFKRHFATHPTDCQGTKIWIQVSSDDHPGDSSQV
jgi:hypothetical protein